LPRVGSTRHCGSCCLPYRPTWRSHPPASCATVAELLAACPPLRAIPNLLFEDLAADELVAREQVEQFLVRRPEVPTFLLIGGLLGEDTRRKLRILSVERPLYFIEANNAPNHLSLAREARLVQRVIRLLTPAFFCAAPGHALHRLSLP